MAVLMIYDGSKVWLGTPMKYIDLTLPSVADNLALDEALLLEAEAGRRGEILRFWEWSTPAVILGAGSRLAKDVNEAACRTDRVPIVRRSSGGGTVLVSAGCLCYSLVLSYDRDTTLREIQSSFRFILGRMRDALPKYNGGLELAGTSDLALAGKKFSGNSQQRKRHFLLHHGTILYAFDIKPVDRYLLMPTRQPDYRLQRKHSEFLTNLDCDPVDLRLRLLTAWNVNRKATMWPENAVHKLVHDKYAQAEWIRRR
jgi:lipoate---protein ligase